MQIQTAYHLLKCTLLGAVAAVTISGAFGVDALVPELVVAVMGGSVAGIAAKISILA